MESEIDDPNWKALRNVLEYLTDPDNIHEKHVDIALSIVKGTGFFCVALCCSFLLSLALSLSLSLSLSETYFIHP